MKRLLIISFLFITSFSFGQYDCSYLSFAGGTWSLPQGTVSNVCDGEGLIKYEFILNNIGGSTSTPIVYEVRMSFFTLYFEPHSYEGIDESNVTIVDDPNSNGAIKELFFTVSYTEPKLDTLAIIYTLSDWIAFYGDEFYLYISEVTDENNPELCRTEHYELIEGGIFVRDEDFFFYDCVMANNNVASGIKEFNDDNIHVKDLQIETDFFIDVDLDMFGTDQKSELLFQSAGKIEIENQSNVYIEDYHVKACSDRWLNILIESGSTLEFLDCTLDHGDIGITVENGATLKLTNVDFTDFNLAIEAKFGSIIEIDNITIDNIGTGIKFTGGPSPLKFDDVTVKNASYAGVRVENYLDGLLNLKPGTGKTNTYEDCVRGISAYRASIDVQYSDFKYCNSAIELIYSPWSVLNNNDIGYIDYGIYATLASFESQNNTIGTTSGTGKKGIFTVSCPRVEVFSNTNIKAKQFGLFTITSRLTCNNNLVTIQGSQRSTNAGLNQFLSKNEVTYNNFDLINGNNGLLTNYTFESTIGFNDIYGQTERGISLVGGSADNLIEYNVIDDADDGIRTFNGPSNTLKCNDILADEHAILIDSDSEIQEILSNTLDGNVDLLTRSLLGPQEHHGNVFVGESLHAEGLTASIVNLSKFYVDQNTPSLIPADPQPTNLIEPEDDNGNTLDCNNIPAGSGWLLKYSDTTFICNYLTDLDSIQSLNPKKYWKRLYHLMRYYVLNIPQTQWPNCILSKWNSNTVCGLNTLVESEVSLFNTMNHQNPTLDLIDSTAEQLKLNPYQSLYLSKMDSLINEYQSDLDSMVLAQSTLISNSTCTDSIYVYWKEVYLQMLTRINNGEVSQQDINRLGELSEYCAHDNGDAVHWARGLVSEYEDTYYDDYDNCYAASQSRKVIINTHHAPTGIAVYPNPGSDLLTVRNYDSTESYTVTISGLNGQKLIHSNEINDPIRHFNISHLPEGIYILKLKDESGWEYTTRFAKHN